MKKLYSSLLIVLIALGISSSFIQEINIPSNTGIYKVLKDLGHPSYKHEVDTLAQEDVKRGEELVKKGYTTAPNGKKSKVISKHFVCTSCHNTDREDPDLKDASNPEKRLTYCKEKNLPFLQGTTFWGIVNRESWYNDDYIEKYGELVTNARFDLDESIQLCAKECSQGRHLEAWELEAIRAYFWSLEINISDLSLTTNQVKSITTASTQKEKESAIAVLKASYSQKSVAHFIKSHEEQQVINSLPDGNPSNGKTIYDISCKTCHKANGVSLMSLNSSKATKKKFTKHLGSGNHFDLYYITRDGTHPIEGHKSYMPYYPLERLSSQQLKDLISYITVPQ